MLSALHQSIVYTRNVAAACARSIAVAGPTCHAWGSGEKTFVRVWQAAHAIDAGDLGGVLIASVWALGNLILVIESVCAAAHGVRRFSRKTQH